jgi:hypothetical protein
MAMTPARAAQLYEDDFYAWTQLQAKELRRFARSRPNLPLDLAHLAEEIANLGTERRSRIRSWARRILEHLLMLGHSPVQDARRQWIAEVVSFRREIDDHLSASLRRDLNRRFSRLYDQARADLLKKLRLFDEAHIADRIPERCPYTLDQVLGNSWPDAAEDDEGSA